MFFMHILNESSNAQNRKIVSVNGEITRYFRFLWPVVRGIDSSPIGDDAVYSFFYVRTLLFYSRLNIFIFVLILG